MKKIPLLLLLLFSITTYNSYAQENNLEVIKKEIKKLTLKEQNAFKNGDCATVMSLMDDNITFYANGKPSPPKSVIENFCKKIPRPFGTLITEDLKVHPLTPKSAYVVRVFTYKNKKGIILKENVTKIWQKKKEKWKIVHLHSTVKEAQ